MRRKIAAAAIVAAVLFAAAVAAAALHAGSAGAQAYPVPHPTISDYQFIKATTPTQADCAAVGRTCFGPQALRSAYNLGPLYGAGLNG
jgi:hypothetical protein